MKLMLLALLMLSLNCKAEIVELNIYCWEGYTPKAYVDKFKRLIKQNYDIELKLNITYVSKPQEFFNALRYKDADIISPAHNIPKSSRWPLVLRQLILPINLKNVPNYQKLHPVLSLKDFVWHKGEVYAVPLLYGYYGLAYNTAKLDRPDSWNVLWEQDEGKKYTISRDYYEVNIYVTALSLGYKGDEVFDYDLLNKDPAFHQRLKRLAENAETMWDGVDKHDDIKGMDYAAVWGFSINETKNTDQPWALVSPKEGVTGWVDHWAIGHSVRNSPLKKKLAELWINFTLGEEMQMHFHRSLAQQPVIRFESYESEAMKGVVDIKDTDFVNNKLKPWKVLTKRQQNGFSSMWNSALKSVAKGSE